MQCHLVKSVAKCPGSVELVASPRNQSCYPQQPKLDSVANSCINTIVNGQDFSESIAVIRQHFRDTYNNIIITLS